MNLLWAASANADLHSLADHYRDIDVALSIRMRQRVERTPELLTRFPLLGTPLGTSAIRKLRVRQTPFLYYRVDPERIVVLRVLHAARDLR